MIFTIERARWLRGEGHNDSSLLRKDGKMCCLGFHAIACGYTEEQIAGKQEPSLLENVGEKIPKLVVPSFGHDHWQNSDPAMELMIANDNKHMSDEAREKRIKQMFAIIGDDVTFV